MRHKTDGLTKKQKEVLEFIKQFHAENKYPPSIRQICSAINLSSPATVHVHINHLVEKGFIKRSKEGNKALELLVENEYDVRNQEVVKVPLIGKETEGSIIDYLENPNELFSLPSCLIPEKKEVFVLIMKDNSMINKGINLDDMVIIEKTDTVKNGDMVVAMNDNNEITLKTFYKEKGHIKLQPENDTMEEITWNNITILGKAIGLYRKF